MLEAQYQEMEMAVQDGDMPEDMLQGALEEIQVQIDECYMEIDRRGISLYD